MQLITKGVCDVIVFPPLNDQTSTCDDNRLEKTQMYGARRIEDTVTIIQAADDEGMDEHFCRLDCASVTNAAKLTKLIKARSSQTVNVYRECELAVDENAKHVAVLDTAT